MRMIASEGEPEAGETPQAEKHPWSDPRLPWEGKPRRVDIACWAAITLSGLYYFAILPFRASLVGTHPIEANQEVWLDISADDEAIGPLPAFWLENKGVNSLWHVPIPPQGVGVRLHYRSAARTLGRAPSSVRTST